MTDKEKIEQAATNNTSGMDAYDVSRVVKGFKTGVKWRDENPNPEVLALVEAIKKILAHPEMDSVSPEFGALLDSLIPIVNKIEGENK